jgi:hypothetical protein
VVVFLTWLYLSAYILLMGGELNSGLERQQRIDAGEAAEAAPRPAAALSVAAEAPAPPPVERGRGRIAPAATALAALATLRWWRRRRRERGPRFLERPVAPLRWNR